MGEMGIGMELYFYVQRQLARIRVIYYGTLLLSTEGNSVES